jgi:hypothetical protein
VNKPEGMRYEGIKELWQVVVPVEVPAVFVYSDNAKEAQNIVFMNAYAKLVIKNESVTFERSTQLDRPIALEISALP